MTVQSGPRERTFQERKHKCKELEVGSSSVCSGNPSGLY